MLGKCHLVNNMNHLYVVSDEHIPFGRKVLGRFLVWSAAVLLVCFGALQLLQVNSGMDFGFQNWRQTLYAYVLWCICLCWGQVLTYGEKGKRQLFILPAVLFVVSLTVFPLLFGLLIAFSNWNLSNPDGRQFNGLDNLRQMWQDPFYWNALWNMVLYCIAIIG